MVTMAKSLKALLTMTGAAVALSACASADNVAALRQPAMPPVAIAKAALHKPFYRNVSVQEVEGAPEFRWFDGGGIITTRPTRKQVVEDLSRHLHRTDMLAPSRLDGEYMLYTRFDELRGPNVWLGTDKLASARVTFRLVRWRTGELVKESTVETSYRAEWTGFTPEMTRAAIGVAAAPAPVARAVSANGEMTTAFGGRARRDAATRGLMDLAFDQFMAELSEDGSVNYKTAVSCASLNGPRGKGPYLRENASSYAVDCPGSTYNESKTQQVYPSRF